VRSRRRSHHGPDERLRSSSRFGETLEAMRSSDPGAGLRWTLPVFTSLAGYRRTWLARDVVAGVLVVAIAIPLSMGMAEVAGMPPIAGLYSCVLPLLAYALFGSSPQLVIALDASTAAMVAAAVAPLAAGDQLRYAELAGAIALIVGGILIVAGSLRLGFVANLLSRPVLLGYQAGLAVVVIFSQLPKLLGLEVVEDRPLPRAIEIVGGLGDASPQVVAIGMACLGVVLMFAAKKSRIPGALFAIVGATFLVELFGSALVDVPVVGSLPAGLPPISLPHVSTGDIVALLPASAAIAFIAAADTIVSSTAFAHRNRYEVDANRDLVGLGAANLASGASGGITTSASAARTAVVEMVGGRSQIASVTAALLMVMVLLFLTRPLERVPTSALAAVVVGAVVRLIEIRSLRALWRIRRTEFAIAMATIIGAVAVGLLQGIIIGVSLSLLDHLVRVALLRRGAERPGRAGPVMIATAPTADGGIGHADFVSTDEILVRVDGSLFFANAHRLKDAVRARVSEQPAATRVVVDASRVTDADATVAEMLAELDDDLAGHGVTLELAELRPPVRGVLKEGFVRSCARR
jgi:high affinity sulfate transporter 1